MSASASFLLAMLLGASNVSTEASAIEAPGPHGRLSGTMLSPSAKFSTVVLIIPGSGPTDRDGNNPLGVKAAPYRLLAEGLAAHRVASVRIDKRGMFASAAAVPDANAVTIPDYVADTGAWVGAIRARTGAKCVWLLGHSEGGLVALASSELPGVCGIVLVSAPGRRLGDVLKDQLRANPANAPLLPDAVGAVDALTAGMKVDVSGFHPALRHLFAPQVQDFLISAFAYDPAALLARTSKPVLIVQGEADLQVTAKDAQILAKANPAAKLTLLAGVNHVLKSVEAGDAAANIASYADPNLPLAPGVVETISAFVGAGPRR